MKSILFDISLMDCAFGFAFKNARSPRFFPMVFPRSFIVFLFTFRSLIHFESFFFFFVNGVRSVSIFISLHVCVQLAQHSLLESLSLPHCIAFAHLLKKS